MSLHTELILLFDKTTIMQSKMLTLEQVDSLAVNRAAGALLRLKGQPSKQVELVQAMQPLTAAALCRWLADPGFWSIVGNISKH